MDLITGKALKAFKAYINKENGWTSQDFTEHYKCQGNNKYTCADIIDWLDSVEIYITINFVDIFNEFDNKKGYEAYVTNKGLSTKYRPVASRHQATQEAVKKAVEIFNDK